MADRPPRPGFQFPGPPPKEVLDYFRGRDLRPGFSFRDVWLEEHAHAFTVAKAMETQILDAIRKDLDKAIAEGKTLRQFQKELTPRLQTMGWWGKQRVADPRSGKTVVAQLGSPRRLRTIYQSNLRAARAAGQWDRAQRTKKVRPYFLYALGPSKEHRDKHEAWAGTILPVDDPWWNDHFPPNGWGCKCRVRQISQREAERRGGATARPPRDLYRRTDPRTGRFQIVDRGVDPAWASNPGKHRGRILSEHFARTLEEADQKLAHAAVESAIRSPALNRYFGVVQDYRRRVLPHETKVKEVDIEHDAVKDWIGQQSVGVVDDRFHNFLDPPSDAKFKRTRVVRLSPENAVKQVINHSDLRLRDYRRLPEVIRHGEIYQTKQPNRVVIYRNLGGRVYRAIVKQTQNNELFLLSFRHVRRRELDAIRRRTGTSPK